MRRALSRSIDVVRSSNEARLVCLIVAIWICFSLTVDVFGSEQTYTSVFGRSVTDGLLVIALVICLLGGQIDLSIGSTLALAGVVFAKIQPEVGLGAGVAAAVLAGCGVGLVNALLMCIVRVNSFIATLGTLLLARSLALVISDGSPVAGTDLDAALWMNEGVIGPLSPRVFLLLGVLGAAAVFLWHTPWGRDIYAVGGNQQAAEAAGIPVWRRLALTFVLSGAIAGLAGAQQAISLLSASPVLGDTNLLAAAAAAFLGGVALTGGRGSVVAGVLAVLALSSIATGLELAQIESAYQQIVLGTVIIAIGLMALGGSTRLGRAANLVRTDS